VRGIVGHLPAIEGLRGIAVSWVIAFHYLSLRGGPGSADPWVAAIDAVDPLSRMLRNGYLGVDLFFLITGFLLVLPWIRNAEAGVAPPSARDFYRRRARRILPAYWTHLALLAVLFIPLILGADAWARAWRFYVFNLGVHAGLLHYTTPLTSASMSVNGALWTLALEAQWYLLLPLLAPLFVRKPIVASSALVVAAFGWRWLSEHDMQALVRFHMGLAAIWDVPEAAIRHFLATQLPGYFAHFAFGMLAGLAWWRWRGHAVSRPIAWAWAGLAALALAFLYQVHIPGSFRLGLPAWFAVALALGTAMLALVSTGNRVATRFLSFPPIAFAGRISYSAYLYHLPVLLVMQRHAPGDHVLALPAYLVVVTGLAWLSWRYVELPFMLRSTARAEAHRERGEDGEGLEQRHAP
jgi:peptidoglycan/LPS O-acetylase OafA/YrhL